MTIRTGPWPAGVPCWVDLASPDLDVARALYGQVMGWEFDVQPAEYGGYVMCHRNGGAAAGMGPAQQGASPAWTLYFASDNVDATAGTVSSAGGTVLFGPMDVPGQGRMLVAADPQGALFGVWQSGGHHGSALVNQPGGLVWEDGRMADPESARSFYAAVFGHRYEAMPEAGDGYTTFSLGDGERPLGGLGRRTDEESPPHWLVYFAVDHADAAVAATQAHGGSVVAPAFDTRYGRMAVLTDHAGARFAIRAVTGASDDVQH